MLAMAAALLVAPASDAKALRLMGACRAATGGAALDRHDAFYEVGRVVRDGRAGTYEVHGDLRGLRVATRNTIDGVPSEGGYDGASAWRRMPDGRVASRDGAAAASARSEAYFTLSAYFFPDRFPATFTYAGVKGRAGRAYDVVHVTPQDATPADLWLDRRTHRVKGFSVEEGGETGTGEIWDERRVDGVMVGFENRQVQGRHMLRQTLTSFRYVPLDPSRFVKPAGG